MEPSVEPGGECAVACGNRVWVGFPEVVKVKLLHFYTEFLVSPNFYTFTILAHFFSPRCARVLQSYKYKAHVSADFLVGASLKLLCQISVYIYSYHNLRMLYMIL